MMYLKVENRNVKHKSYSFVLDGDDNNKHIKYKSDTRMTEVSIAQTE